MARSRRSAKQKPKAIILPPELDEDDEEAGSVIPDDDGWITLEGDNGSVQEGNGNPVPGDGKRKIARVAPANPRKRQKRAD